MAHVTFESVSWTDARALELQRILEEDLHGRYAQHLQPGPGRDAALRALSVDPDEVRATVTTRGCGALLEAGLHAHLLIRTLRNGHSILPVL